MSESAWAADLPRVGARASFTTHEAEDATTTGAVIRHEGWPKADVITPELEASGRAFVRLARTGDHCDFTAKSAGDTLVIRHSSRDADAGGGRDARLRLSVNGQFVRELTISSKAGWLYGDHKSPGAGQSNNPSDGPPRHFWCDTPFWITDNPWRKGDVLRIENADDTSHVDIDLVDMELVPGANTPSRRRRWLSIVDFGATADDASDDTVAIERCLLEAKAKEAGVWFPPGVFRHSRSFVVDGVAVEGAGLWRTSLIGAGEQLGFILAGGSASVSHLSITSEVHTSRTDRGGIAFRSSLANDWRVEDIRVLNVNVGFWMSRTSRGVVRGCRAYCTNADAINVNRNSRKILIENNFVRGAGDDGIATLSESRDPEPTRDVVIRRNTVVANWWGHNIDVAGGEGHVVEDNYLADNSHSACIALNHPPAYPMHPLTGALLRRNTIVRGGGNFARQRRGAIWTLSGKTTITGVRFEENRLIEPMFRGLHLHGSGRQEIAFVGNQIVSPGGEVIRVDPEVHGKLVLRGNLVTQRPSDTPLIDNAAGEALDIAMSDDAWD